MTESERFVVLKFGGTSVSSRESWETVASVVRDRLEEGVRPVVVHSALAGVSALIDRVVDAAVAGSGEHGALVREVLERHRHLASELGLPELPGLAAWGAGLDRLAEGVSLIGDAPPAVRARALAHGELLTTTLGATFLNARGIRVRWVDARLVLESRDTEAGPADPSSYLSAECDSDPDPELQGEWAGSDAVVVTQGFIARSPRGETVLLGWGGSDASAAYLAGKLEAERLEIWTDVPGMFSADPRRVPTARLLKRLSYAEAQEIATTGSTVLHPRAIPAIRDAAIPIHIRSTPHPDMPGTVIGDTGEDATGRVKAISAKKGITLVSLETFGMWQEVGFLARAFEVFRRWGLSIDLVSTSESTVTLSLDPLANVLERDALDGLVRDLSAFSKVEILRNTAAVSLVGRRIRGMLHRLGPALEVFQEERVHLVSQAASDLNLTFVVDAGQADRLVARLHSLLIRPGEDDPVFGLTWESLTAGEHEAPGRPAVWWERKRDALLELMSDRDSAYVYDLDTVGARAAGLLGMGSVHRVLYSLKANPHPGILRALDEAGLGFECVSADEVRHLLDTLPSLDPARVLFTPNFAPRDEYAFALEAGVRLTIDALHPVVEWPELFRDRSLFLRIDPGQGAGHHEKVRTAGGGSKFGMPLEVLDEARDRLAAVGARVVGLHAHAGSGILDPDHWARVGGTMARLLERFPHVRVVDLGGGIGVPDQPGEPGVELDALDSAIAAVRDAVAPVEVWIEPGRYLVAEAGVLLARVTQVKAKGATRYVGVATGMNSLIRPALYGAYHEIRNLSRPDAPKDQTATVVGPICETGDRFGTDRLLPDTREGDVLVFANAGAYGHVMSSRYNLREPAGELVIQDL